MTRARSSVTLPGSPRLEGAWCGVGDRVAVVAPPHPLMGGELDNPVVLAIAEGFVRAGVRVLLFNYRGVGESHGDASGDFSDALTDYRAALAAAAAEGPVRFLAGYSFGGGAALHSAKDAADAAVFAVAPPPALVPEGFFAAARGGVIVAGGRDGIAPGSVLQELVTASSGVRFEGLPDADHFFGGHTGDITRFAAALAEAS